MRNTHKMLWSAVMTLVVVGGAICVRHATALAQVADPTARSLPLRPPATGRINVAFIVSADANVMDIAGPWEVFEDTMLTSQGKPWHKSDGNDMVMPFNNYTVADSLKPIDASGLTIIPNYTFANAPKPQIIVVPAQGGRTPTQKAWLLANSQTADVTMSVCTGASMLAQYGLLDGQTATTHHLYEPSMQKKYPNVHFVSGTRFVDNGKIATAGGLTSGVDLALHVVQRYYGHEAAQGTADFLEYGGELWTNSEYTHVKAGAASK